MSQQPCPEVETLRPLLLGELFESEAAQLERHILTCPACAARLQALEDEDSLVRAMRAQASGAGWPHGEDVERLMAASERADRASQ